MPAKRTLKDAISDSRVKPETDARSTGGAKAAVTDRRTTAAQRDIAKTGMLASLGTLVATGFFRFKGARLIHPWAGWAFIGFSLWHHMMNSPQPKKRPMDR